MARRAEDGIPGFLEHDGAADVAEAQAAVFKNGRRAGPAARRSAASAFSSRRSSSVGPWRSCRTSPSSGMTLSRMKARVRSCRSDSSGGMVKSMGGLVRGALRCLNVGRRGRVAAWRTARRPSPPARIPAGRPPRERGRHSNGSAACAAMRVPLLQEDHQPKLHEAQAPGRPVCPDRHPEPFADRCSVQRRLLPCPEARRRPWASAATPASPGGLGLGPRMPTAWCRRSNRPEPRVPIWSFNRPRTCRLSRRFPRIMLSMLEVVAASPPKPSGTRFRAASHAPSSSSTYGRCGVLHGFSLGGAMPSTAPAKKHLDAERPGRSSPAPACPRRGWRQAVLEHRLLGNADPAPGDLDLEMVSHYPGRRACRQSDDRTAGRYSCPVGMARPHEPGPCTGWIGAAARGAAGLAPVQARTGSSGAHRAMSNSAHGGSGPGDAGGAGPGAGPVCFETEMLIVHAAWETA